MRALDSARILLRLAMILLGVLLGCSPKRFAKIPGETDTKVSKVTIVGEGGKPLHLEWEPLLVKLGLRAGGLIYTDRYFNPYRLAEDRRRVQTYFQTYGWLDAVVLEPRVDRDDAKDTVAVTWTVREGERYRLDSIEIKHAPKDTEPSLRGLLPFAPGDAIDLEAQRRARYSLAEHLQRAGFGHARVYSRTYVDRTAKKIHQYYFVDAGPKTKVGALRVEGNVRIPSEDILRRIGLRTGDPLSLTSKEKAEFDLLDTGAFASAVLDAELDTELYIGDVPDSGGTLYEGQVDENGELVLRKLPEDVPVVVRVVEAPSKRLKVRAGIEGDSHRVDAIVGEELLLRNALGALHHVSLQGRVGYGWIWRRGGDNDEISGLYGDAGVRYDHPGFLGRLLDLRITARYRDVLYPSFHLRELLAGPGTRTAITRTLFFDLDAFFRMGWQVAFGPFDDATRRDFALPSKDDAKGALFQTSIVWDERNDPIEPMRGHLLSLRAGYGAGDFAYVVIEPEARGWLPLNEAWSVGARVSFGFIPLHGDGGVPLGPRFFGGGAFGMRGFFRNRLSPTASVCTSPPLASACSSMEVGGLSLLETSIEARWLPFQKPLGLTFFTDTGGAGRRSNPFETGPSFASGFGLRIRTWFAPIGIDVAYRWMKDGQAERFGLDPFLFFVRVGEAF